MSKHYVIRWRANGQLVWLRTFPSVDEALTFALKAFPLSPAFADEKVYITEENPAEVPERERWLWENPAALASVREGLEQSRRGELIRLEEDFTEYMDDYIEDENE